MRECAHLFPQNPAPPASRFIFAWYLRHTQFSNPKTHSTKPATIPLRVTAQKGKATNTMKIVSITCATENCGNSPFPLEEGHYRRARRTHENFYCPQGHSNYYDSESDLEKLTRINRGLRRDITRYQQTIADQIGHCPWIQCDFEARDQQGLRTHMRARHGMPTLAAVEEVA